MCPGFQRDCKTLERAKIVFLLCPNLYSSPSYIGQKASRIHYFIINVTKII